MCRTTKSEADTDEAHAVYLNKNIHFKWIAKRRREGKPSTSNSQVCRSSCRHWGQPRYDRKRDSQYQQMFLQLSRNHLHHLQLTIYNSNTKLWSDHYGLSLSSVLGWSIVGKSILARANDGFQWHMEQLLSSRWSRVLWRACHCHTSRPHTAEEHLKFNLHPFFLELKVNRSSSEFLWVKRSLSERVWHRYPYHRCVDQWWGETSKLSRSFLRSDICNWGDLVEELVTDDLPLLSVIRRQSFSDVASTTVINMVVHSDSMCIISSKSVIKIWGWSHTLFIGSFCESYNL